MADVWIKEGDTAPVIRRTLLDGDGNAVDIAGASVRFLIRALRGGFIMGDDAENEQVVDDDDTVGLVSYTLAVGLEPGGYAAEFEVTYASDAVETFPNSGYITVAVLAQIEEPAS